MENRSYALWAGLFTVFLAVGLIAGIYWFSRDSRDRVPIEFVSRNSVAGLSSQSSVRYRGVEVGKVSSIRLDPRTPGLIVVRAGIDPMTPITRSSFASLGYQGVTGLAFVQLDDTGQSTEHLKLDRDRPVRIELQPGLVDRLAQRGDALMKQAEEVVRRANNLLSDPNQDAVMKMFRDVSAASQALKTASSEFSKMRAQLSPTLERLPRLADDAHRALARTDTTLQRVDNAAVSLTELADKLKQNGGVLDQAAQGIAEAGFALSRAASDTLPRINTLAEEGTRSARALTRAADALNEQPQSLIFGRRGAQPGPGEDGFVPPPASETPH